MEPTHKKRILFVDDEPQILQSLERTLRPYRKEIEVTFANGGEAAIELLTACPFDVLVTDIRMPRVDGIELLHFTKKNYPSLIRIALSGQTDMEETIRTLSLAHQFLSKPCRVDTLYRTISRAYELYQMLGSAQIKQTLASLSELPVLPLHLQTLQEQLQSNKADPSQIAELIERDVGMSAKLLQIANSPPLRATRTLSTAREVASFLDIPTLRSLVLTGKIFQACELPGETYDDFYQHSLLVGSIARSIVDIERCNEAFTAGVLHDIGELILDAYAIDPLTRAANHSHVGGAILSLWGLPHPLVEAVTRHHEPPTTKEFGSLDAVYIAQLLVRQLERGSQQFSDIERNYLRRADLWERIPQWLEIAKRREENVRLNYATGAHKCTPI
jgi:putative nucleotidyltransferase with HDIG domain